MERLRQLEGIVNQFNAVLQWPFLNPASTPGCGREVRVVGYTTKIVITLQDHKNTECSFNLTINTVCTPEALLK